MAEEKEVVTTKSDYTNTSMANVMDYMIKTIMKENINTAIPVVVTSVIRNGDGSGPVLYPQNP
jgi:two-component SAPR family response regulator